MINGKFIEGHVPVAEIHLLNKRRDLAGIAVPGVHGTPGTAMPVWITARRTSLIR